MLIKYFFILLTDKTTLLFFKPKLLKMKLVKLCLFTVFTICFSQSVFSQNFTYHPENPVPGEKVTVTYNPIGTPLERAEKIEVVAYEFTEEGPMATEVYLHLKNASYEGKLIVSKDTKIVFLSFSNEDKRDNNSGEGYNFWVYQKDRKSPINGAFVSMSEAYAKYYRTIGVDRDYNKALNYLDKAYSLNPDLKAKGKHLSNYSYYASKTKNAKVLEECKELIKTMRLHADSEEDMITIKALYTNTGDKEGAKAIEDKIILEYPKGETVQRNLVNSFYKAKSLDDKLKIYKTISTEYTDSELVKSSMNRIVGSLAMDYGKTGDWESFDEYFSKIDDKVSKASYLNSLAWTFSGESTEANTEQAGKGLELSKKSLDLISAAMESYEAKPDSRTKNQWKKQLTFTYGMYADTYALCAYHEGKFDDAFHYQAKACKSNKFGDGEMNERYAIYLEKAEGPEAAEEELLKIMSQGNATSKMKDQYKRLYMANNTLESAMEKNMAFLQQLADEKKKKELENKMVEQIAPNFSLVNLNGEQITLNDLKGKVVILDFWATWCGPCKASFPGMQTAVEKYKDNDEVVFLFLDTWERSDEQSGKCTKIY